MRPRTVHLLLLGLISGPLLVLGSINLVHGLNSHAELSGISVAVGFIMLAAGTLYALASSLLAWRLGGSARRVAAVHGACVGAVAALVALGFLRRFV